MTNNVEQHKFEINKDCYTRGTYNGISVIIHDKDGFINASEMCKQFHRRFAKINENHAWQQYYQAFVQEYTTLPEMGGCSEPRFSYQINKGIPDKLKFIRGTYVDPRLVNYIAIWASPQYAIYVGKIMDNINNKVHEVLQEHNLEDTPQNAQVIFANIVENIKPALQSQKIEEEKCWGIRESTDKLGYWERQELEHDIRNYNSLKSKFIKAQEKVENWGTFVQEYCPEFEK